MVLQHALQLELMTRRRMLLGSSSVASPNVIRKFQTQSPLDCSPAAFSDVPMISSFSWNYRMALGCSMQPIVGNTALVQRLGCSVNAAFPNIWLSLRAFAERSVHAAGRGVHGKLRCRKAQPQRGWRKKRRGGSTFPQLCAGQFEAKKRSSAR